jgi:DNA-binding IscR family transcriptional regulator
MKDTRLARMLHVLVHMHLLGGTETSATIGLMLSTNPVVVRRIMGQLREAGLVESTGGRAGGWRLARPAAEIRLSEVHRALSTGSILAIGLSKDHPNCPVEQAGNVLLSGALAAAEAALVEALAQSSLADLAAMVPRGT